MNWSTRFRRCVRISVPPVREASMKPTAATVLPAPVACSNQKRRLAPGSSGASSTTSSSVPSGSSQSRGSSSGSSSSASSASPFTGAPFIAGSSSTSAEGSSPSLRAPLPRPFEPGFSISETSAARVPDSASTWCSFSSAPSASVGFSVSSSRSSPSISEYWRRHSTEGVSRPSSSSASAASTARRRAVPGARSSGLSPSSRIASRTNFAARSISSFGSRVALPAATPVVSDMETRSGVRRAAGRGRERCKLEWSSRRLASRFPSAGRRSPRSR